MIVLLLVVSCLISFFAGFTITALATGNRMRDMQVQLDESVNRSDVLKEVRKAVCPPVIKGASFWNAALKDVEEKVKAL